MGKKLRPDDEEIKGTAERTQKARNARAPSRMKSGHSSSIWRSKVYAPKIFFKKSMLKLHIFKHWEKEVDTLLLNVLRVQNIFKQKHFFSLENIWGPGHTGPISATRQTIRLRNNNDYRHITKRICEPSASDECHDEVTEHHLLIADLLANVLEPLVKVAQFLWRRCAVHVPLHHLSDLLAQNFLPIKGNTIML